MAPYHKRPRMSDPEEGVINNEDEETLAEEVGEVDGSVDSEATIPPAIIKFEAWLQSADGGNLDKIGNKSELSKAQIIKYYFNRQSLPCLPTSLLDKSSSNNSVVALLLNAEQCYKEFIATSNPVRVKHNVRFLINLDELNDCEDLLSDDLGSWNQTKTKKKWYETRCDINGKVQKVVKVGDNSPDAFVVCRRPFVNASDRSLHKTIVDITHPDGKHHNIVFVKYEFVNAPEHEVKVKHHGNAEIVQRLWIERVLRQVRSKLPYITAEKEQPLFPSWNGKKFESGQISKAIQSVWKKAGTAGPIHSTLFRKGAVTVCHSSQKEMTSDLADLMAHKEDTAKRYYRLTEKSKTCVKASQQLHTVMRVNSQKDSVEENTCSKEELEPSEQEAPGSASRVPWSSVAVDEIRRLFHEEILGKSLSLKSVKEKISGSEILKNEDPKRAYDRVRAEWRFPGSDDKTNPSLPTETEEMKDRVDRMFTKDAASEDVTSTSDIIPPTTIASKGKALFIEGHVRTLHRLFNDML
ncbi:unnamed protein product, partial [Porites lobata]